MTLSVIIVNYNVKFFLEQCLFSVQRACKQIEAEIIVVDNHSTDGSVEYLQEAFPEIKFIVNDANLGFTKACNIGLGASSGNFILFLNPDTIVAEDTLSESIAFFSSHPDCGALGVKMIDGSGSFLKESKRSFPSPLTSLYKLSGLARLFPGSRVFGHYHLGHYNKNQNHEVSVLSGAYMMIRKQVLDKTGCFDERFFMYGEDVDLSYRIQKAGFKNYYVADTTIVHFKGESTKKGSLNYVRMFYQAMSIFVQKHYKGTRAWIFHTTIQFAIWIRAMLAGFAKLLRWVGLPTIDGLLILFSFWMVKELWIVYIRPDIRYTPSLLNYSFPAFTVIYLFIAYCAGLYDRFYRSGALIRSTFVATLILIALYSLLPEHMRFSRGIVLFGALLAIVLISAIRMLLINLNLLSSQLYRGSRPYILIVASREEYPAVISFLEKRKLGNKIIGRIGVSQNDNEAITHLDHVNEVALPLDAKEIIFCAGALSYKNIIRQVALIGHGIRIRFHAVNSSSIIGSDMHSSKGEILSDETDYNLSILVNRRNKRMVDIALALIGIIGFPIHLFFVKNPVQFFKNCFPVLFGRKTWIGYFDSNSRLPRIAPGILGPNGHPHSESPDLPENSLQMIDYFYARDYEWIKDCKMLLLSYKSLGS